MATVKDYIVTPDSTNTLTNKGINADNNLVQNLEVGNLKSTAVSTAIPVTGAVDTKLATEKAVADGLDSKLSLTGGTLTGDLSIVKSLPSLILENHGGVRADLCFKDVGTENKQMACIRVMAGGNLQFGRASQNGTYWFNGAMLLLNYDGSLSLIATDDAGANGKSLVLTGGANGTLKWDGKTIGFNDNDDAWVTFSGKTGLRIRKNNGWVNMVFDGLTIESGKSIVYLPSKYRPIGERVLFWTTVSGTVEGAQIQTNGNVIAYQTGSAQANVMWWVG